MLITVPSSLGVCDLHRQSASQAQSTYDCILKAVDDANDLFDAAIQRLEQEEGFDIDKPPAAWDQLNDLYGESIRLKAILSTQFCVGCIAHEILDEPLNYAVIYLGSAANNQPFSKHIKNLLPTVLVLDEVSHRIAWDKSDFYNEWDRVLALLKEK